MMKSKPPKCSLKGCKLPATMSTGLVRFCGPEHGAILAQQMLAKKRAKAAKESRRETKAAKEKLKTRSNYLKEAQVAFNTYIRERDKNKLCICCAKPLGAGEVGGAYDCGHYRSVGSAPHLRFDERNAHAQRKQCNRYGAGRAVDYRLGLIERLGLVAVESLESDQTQRKWSIDELRAIKAHYRAKTKALLALYSVPDEL